MEFIVTVIDFFLHLDKHLSEIVQACGGWTYLILFLVIFCETGLVVTPFLPGDSLLFAVGALAALGVMDITSLFVLLCVAAIGGNISNYGIGYFFGPKMYHDGRIRFVKKQHLDKTHRFFEKYGGFTIVISRFVPIVRTIAPFLAGMGAMTWGRFLIYNLFGGLAWITLFLFGGYFFGNIPIVKRNFTLVILVIVVLSVLPILIEVYRHRGSNNPEAETTPKNG